MLIMQVIKNDILGESFYSQSAILVARDLLGCKLLRNYNNHILGGTITETEAYLGKDDSASHAYRGLTKRNKILFGKPGFAYIYLIYGLHYMFNISVEPEGKPCAVLIRAIKLDDGMKIIKQSSDRNDFLLNGPAKVCKALLINKELNGIDLTQGNLLWITKGEKIHEDNIEKCTRIGIDYAQPKDRASLLRFRISS
jgi:DNA-3-methyladenine glycosylase